MRIEIDLSLSVDYVGMCPDLLVVSTKIETL